MPYETLTRTHTYTDDDNKLQDAEQNSFEHRKQKISLTIYTYSKKRNII